MSNSLPILNINVHVYDATGHLIHDPGIVIGALMGTMLRDVIGEENMDLSYDPKDPFWQHTTPAEYIEKMNDVAHQLNVDIDDALEKCCKALEVYRESVRCHNYKKLLEKQVNKTSRV